MGKLLSKFIEDLLQKRKHNHMHINRIRAPNEMKIQLASQLSRKAGQKSGVLPHFHVWVRHLRDCPSPPVRPS